jgi:hypothetical protein
MGLKTDVSDIPTHILIALAHGKIDYVKNQIQNKAIVGKTKESEKKPISSMKDLKPATQVEIQKVREMMTTIYENSDILLKSAKQLGAKNMIDSFRVFEEQGWEDALKNTKVNVDNKKNEWMYRGIFPKNGEETITRASFNVHVTPELIDKLDDMILIGKIKANYKFGQPGTTASPTERHDAISIYFLEEPNEDVLKELSQIIKPYVRGDNLLGKKIDDGFFMSEIGSIETKHIEKFVEDLKLKDAVFAESVKRYTSPLPGKGNSLKMSEAQFYAVKDVARAFGYSISYNKNIGFEIN